MTKKRHAPVRGVSFFGFVKRVEAGPAGLDSGRVCPKGEERGSVVVLGQGPLGSSGSLVRVLRGSRASAVGQTALVEARGDESGLWGLGCFCVLSLARLFFCSPALRARSDPSAERSVAFGRHEKRVQLPCRLERHRASSPSGDAKARSEKDLETAMLEGSPRDARRPRRPFSGQASSAWTLSSISGRRR